jgi:serine protease AprX
MNLPRLVCAVALVTTLGVGSAAGQRLDDSLRDSVARGCTGSKSVIIRTTPGAREALRNSLVSQGRRVKGEFPSLDAISADVRCDDLKLLASFGQTASVSDNATVHGHQSSLESGWNRFMEALSAQQLQTSLFSTLGVRQSVLGTLARYVIPPVGVAIIDSGIQPGPDFGSRITAFYDFTHGDIRPATPSDEYGHGTHVAGLAGGTYVGIAPSARLIGLKVLDGQGQGTTDNVIRAIEFAIANKNVLNIDVINLSLGHPIFEAAATDPLVQAVEHASREGIVVVVSAGNVGRHPTTGQIGYGGLSSPGNAPSGISVGSLRTFDTVGRNDDRVAAYSSRGPSRYDGFAKPDISAPGDNLLSVAATGSTLRLAQERRGNTGNYMRLSGTSMAAGVVSGMVALILQTNENLTPNALKMVLQYSSIPVKNDDGTISDVLSQGAGSMNGSGAITLARAINPTLAIGQKWLVTNVTPATVIGGQTYVWAQRMVWGNHIAVGTGIIDEQRPSWALNIVWGEGFDDDDNIVWGNRLDDDDNIVWGNRFDDDDNIVWGNLFDDDDNIVWGNLFDDDDNIVWGNRLDDDDNIVWGNSALLGSVMNWIQKGVN